MKSFPQKFEVIKRIGKGGMADIFLIHMEGLQGFAQYFAMKRLHANLTKNENFVRMFFDEARTAASLHHRNVAEIYELGRVADSPYILMEYVDGVDLRTVINVLYRTKAAMPPRITACIVLQICRGLDYAHSKRDGADLPLGIVHGDVSPQNILISQDGEVKIIDFGVARARAGMAGNGRLRIQGKPAYLSPEQAAGERIDHRSDLFSLGIVFYELITVTRLFKRKTQEETVRAVLEGEILPPSALCTCVPPMLESIVIKALERDPARRYASAKEMEADLIGYQRANPPDPRPEEVGEFVRRLTQEK